MAVPIVWRSYTTEVKGAVLKRVTCEGCGGRYVYRMERSAEGQGTSPYMIDNRGAERRSSTAADRALLRKLQRECDIVPCPACGTVQEDMVRRSRGGQHRWLRRIAIGLILLAVMLGVMNWLSTADGARYQLLSWSTIAVIAMSGPAVLAVRGFLQAAHDPNDEPVHQRIEEGRARAMPEEEYERIARDAAPPGDG